MERLFTYGTLRDSEVQREVLGKESAGVPDSLSNYRLSSLDIGGEQYPIAEPGDGGKIEGVAYEVQLEELKKIDEYEGQEYRRIKVTLDSGLEAWIYTRQF
jgi:gamma-glutamylcyclotransferase (GGCT)/AIG2-like uncharacterized protein YtfP